MIKISKEKALKLLERQIYQFFRLSKDTSEPKFRYDYDLVYSKTVNTLRNIFSGAEAEDFIVRTNKIIPTIANRHNKEKLMANQRRKIEKISLCIGELRNFQDLINDFYDEQSHENKLRKSKDSVFIVHGHNKQLLLEVKDFIKTAGITPIILSEKASKGRTIIEKIEEHSSAHFAIILLTPDDIGYKNETDIKPKARARQNVILEMGYFIGKIGRSNVAVLYDKEVEMPSDYRGVEYIRVDSGKDWKIKLAKEMQEAGMRINYEEIIKNG